MQRLPASVLVVMVFVTFLSQGVLAATPASSPLKVAVLVSEPFVIRSDSGFTGYAIELWEHVAAQLGLNYQYEEVADIPSLLNRLTAGDVDVALTELTVTSERMKLMDFTQPWFDSGLRIMVHHQNLKGFSGFVETLKETGHLPIIMLLLCLIVLMTLCLTWVDRKFDPEFPSRWSSGLAESFYHVMSLVTSGSTSHKPMFGSLGRVLAAIWLVVGVGIVTYITSTVTAVMTTNTLEDRFFKAQASKVKGLDDLKGSSVGVLTGSVAAIPLREKGIAVREFDTVNGLMEAVSQGTVDALLADEPSLNYYLMHHSDLQVAPVGPLVRHEKYAYALKLQSALRVPLSKEVVAAAEAGVLKELTLKYFGAQAK